MVLGTGRFRLIHTAVGALVLVLLSSEAHGQQPPPVTSTARSAVGFQGGLSIDPEQVFAGVYWQSPEIGSRFHLRPGIDGGFGSDARVATINIDFVVRFPLGNAGWSFVQGGGPTIVITRVSIGDATFNDVGAGGSYILGFAHDAGFFTEFRLGGGGRTPAFKLGAGYQLAW